MILKKWIFVLMIFVFVQGFAGCATVPRADQEIEGNAGYVKGAPQPEDRSGVRKDRPMVEGKAEGISPWQAVRNIDNWIKENMW